MLAWRGAGGTFSDGDIIHREYSPPGHYSLVNIVRGDIIHGGDIIHSDTVKKAERNLEIAARTLCLRVCGAMPRSTAAVKIPLPRQHFSSRILFYRKLSENYFF